MFNKDKKRIEELEKQVKELCEEFKSHCKEIKSVEKDAITKNLHYVEDMVCIKGERKHVYNMERVVEYCEEKGIIFELKNSTPKDFYFLKGTEPKCDFIKEDIDGKLSYYKNNVECDMGGKMKK